MSQPRDDDSGSTGENEGVGYGRPPIHSRFKPKNSGNPKGRPSKPKSTIEAVTRHLDTSTTVRKGGKPKRMTLREILIAKTYDRALAGDNRATAILLTYDMASRRNADDPGQGSTEVFTTEHSKEIIEAYMASRAEADEQ